jgi:UDP-2,3-diacylglucosamine pyrophosphatase LpxH
MSRPKRIEVKSTKEVRTLVIPDQHFPFVNQDHLASVVSAAKELKPTFIVNVGDTYDMYSFSRFARSMDVVTPREELRQGREMAECMWADLQKAAPKALCFQVLGNHEERIRKRIMDRAPEYEAILERPISELTEFSKVTSLGSSKSELVINDTVFIHGWSTTPGFHVRYFLQNVVHGHTHRGGVSYVAVKGKTLFELDCGFIADADSLPLEYRETKTSSWHPGFGFIDKFGPRFISL